MSIWNRNPLLNIQKIHCGAGVQDFPKITWEQDEFTQMAPFTGKFILLFTASQQHSECLQVSQLLPRGTFQNVSKHAVLDAPAAPARFARPEECELREPRQRRFSARGAVLGLPVWAHRHPGLLGITAVPSKSGAEAGFAAVLGQYSRCHKGKNMCTSKPSVW